MAITPRFIAPIKLPKTPKTARIAPIPAEALQAPKDKELVAAIKALALPEAPLILKAYEAFGKTTLFEARLLEVLVAFPLEDVDDRLQVHLARLGAEAYVLDIEITGLSYGLNKVGKIGFVSSLDDLPGMRAELWTQFVMRRFVEMSEVELTGDETHVQFHKALDFLKFVQAEHEREYRLVIESRLTLEEYRTVLFKIVQKHYQALFDGMFAKTSRSRYKAGVKQLKHNLDASLEIERDVDVPPMVNAYRLDGMTFMDYFDPKDETNLDFLFFSAHTPPFTADGPAELKFRSVLEKRFQQHVLLDDLAPQRAPHSPPFPAPPLVHDSESWQVWARKMWPTTLTREEPHETLRRICNYISRYFHTLTAAIPFDLEEGPGVKSFLTRIFPRAINGGLIHDCYVYAIRWIFMLGQLLDPKTMPADLADPRIWLIEMPAHAGVMIRVRPVQRLSTAKKEILIAINNQNAVVSEIDPTDGLEETADQVVEQMYSGPPTPMLITKIKARPTDARKLWREFSKLAAKKSVLPYKDPVEPHLQYLEYTSANGKIIKRLREAITPHYQRMREKLSKLTTKSEATRRRELATALEQYKLDIKPAFAEAAAETERIVKPLADAIKKDIAANQDQVDATGAHTTPESSIPNWDAERVGYELKINAAKELLTLDEIDPEVVFGRDELQIGVY